MDAVSFLSSAVAFLEASKYFLLFAGSYLEGTAVMLTGGFLWREGIVAFLPAYLCLMAGDFLSDLMWYFIGFYGGTKFIDRWGYLLNASPAVMEKARRQFHKYHLEILIFSKLTMGFGLAVPILMTAGLMRVSLLRYIVINVLGSIVWIFAVMCVGYFFGDVFALVPRDFQIAFGVIVFVLFIYGLRTLNNWLAKQDW